MSFSWEVKNELCYNKAIRLQHRREQATGLLQYAGSYDLGKIELDTEHKGVARLYCESISQLLGIEGSLTLITRKIAGRLHYIAGVDCDSDRKRIIELFGTHIPQYENQEQIGALLSGIFMSCGNITDPSKSYHLEFDFIKKELVEPMVDILTFAGLTPKVTTRRGRNVVYFKESEQIEDLLTLMGAPKAALSIMNIKIEKSLRNRVNRANNCDVANLDKTLAASHRQISAIEYIIETRGTDYIPEELKEIARLRCDNPDASLAQIGQLTMPPSSRSAVNRRLVRLVEISDEIRRNIEEKEGMVGK